MCGIVGYVGKQPAAPLLLAGLRRLEYRGYDSAGIATLEHDRLDLRKRQGKIDEGLHPLLTQAPLTGSLGIGHTRWATHGPPSDANAHPHTDASGRIAVVHNGVIENHDRLRQRLLEARHRFLSATDTEVLAHLIGVHYAQLATGRDPARSRLTQAVERALREVIGTYGLAVISADEPGLIVGARRGSPLILGLGQGENLLASDATAVVAHTRQVVYLNDYDLATVTADNFQVTSLGTQTARVQISEIEFGAEAAERGAFPHYMLKEIFEQPATIENALRGRIDLEEATARFGGLNLSAADLRAVDRIVIAACGTSWHAGLVGEHLIEAFAHLPVEVEYASEFRYRNPPLDKHTLVLVITQSGETADTLAALREAKRRGHPVLALCNVVGSTIAREADGGIYLHAGPEIGVASTKAFTSQVTVLTLFALFLGRLRTLSPSRGLAVLRALEQVPDQVRQLLAQNDALRDLAARYADRRDFYFLGRQINFPVALEGALKLKEISYVHAEGYPAAEMKHGPIALMTPESPCVILAPHGFLYEKTLSNLEEVRARQAPVIALTTEGDTALAAKATEVLYVPRTDEFTFPLLGILPLQLLAYHIAVLRGCDVDKPRNLAKSVTVE
ncbi:MAG: glutamine--fructose-6-phosphate transaminase (isomerizing) [Verrucomicrobiales bacterium]|nr:glutamine--fructose-6-phosphate transaminase (isomerizing) [Verrucomicrobiales bacterium]